MQFNFLGDSITAGAGAGVPEKMYTYLVCRHFDAKENNYGVGGTRIAPKTVPSRDITQDETFLERARNMPTDADFTFVFGGTNDYGHGDAPLGQFGDREPDTFYGAVWELCQYLLSRFPREKLCFILPLHRVNEDSPYGEFNCKPIPSGSLSDYVTAIAKTLEQCQIEYIDFGDVFTIEALDSLTADGLHPNPEGHQLIANRLCGYLERKGFSA